MEGRFDIEYVDCTHCNKSGKDPKKRKRKCPICNGMKKQASCGTCGELMPCSGTDFGMMDQSVCALKGTNMEKKKEEKDYSISFNQEENCISGPVIYFNEPTLNGRVYSKEILEREFEKFKKRGFVTYGQNQNIMMTRLQDVVGFPKDVQIDDEKVFMEIKLANTPKTTTFKLSHKDQPKNYKLVMRGVGTVKNGVVQDDFKLVGVDIAKISNPPKKGSYR